MQRTTIRPALRLAATAAAGALLLTACGGDGDGGGGGDVDAGAPAEEVSQEEIDEALSTPTELVFWTWVPDIQNQVDMFMEEYPEIDVEVVNVGQGADHYQKMRSALDAGTGAPDVAQVEYQYIPSFRVSENLLDLAPYGATELEGDYPEWVWSQVSDDGAVYGIPQDVGPMGNLYREDLLTAAGIEEAPATWEEFQAAARTYREANPDSYLTNLPSNQAGQFMGLLWQAGARPFSYDGAETVGVDFSGPEVEQVVEYWNTMLTDDLVSTDPDFTDQWYQGLSSGKYASWQAAAWGPVFLQGTAGNTSGQWRAAPLPQWEEGEEVSGNWGGSTDAVLTTTENPIAAAELAMWINTAEEPALAFATEQFLFPPYTPVLEDPAFTEQESEFYGGQQVNQLFAEISETVSTDFQWLPFMDFAYSSYTETVGAAIDQRSDLMAGVTAWEEELKAYAEGQGFTVE